jgi:proline iminopeptidase
MFGSRSPETAAPVGTVSTGSVGTGGQVRIAVNDVELFFDVEGPGYVPDGPDLREREVCLVLHGGPGMDHTYYRPWLSPLAEDMQLVYIDHRGTGRSGRPVPLESCTIEQMADDVEALRQALGLGKVNVLGNSFGGFWALTYALRYPDSLKKWVLVTTSPSHEFYEAAKAEAAKKGSPEQIAEVPRVFEGQEMTDEQFEHWWNVMAPLYYRRWDDAYLEAAKRGRPNKDIVTYMFKNVIPHYDVRERLKEIAAPTLVIGGRHDWVTPVSQSELLAAGIPDNRLVIFEESGHMPFVEEQAGFVELVRDFMGFNRA